MIKNNFENQLIEINSDNKLFPKALKSIPNPPQKLYALRKYSPIK